MEQRGRAETYDEAFFAAQLEGSARSAHAAVPRILALFPEARSVVDVGCGTGTWLHHFELAGATRVLGLDGAWVEERLLEINPEEFRVADITDGLRIEESFDLCLSLEVAEHLPAEAAPAFVADLCRLSDVIVFSAAIPGQGGTRHVNERWPSYWVEFFRREGFGCFDVLRPQLWYDHRIEWWYAQNLLVFVRLARDDVVARMVERQVCAALDVVHPRCFESVKRKYSHAIEQTDPKSRAAWVGDSRGDLDYDIFRLASETWKQRLALPPRRFARRLIAPLLVNQYALFRTIGRRIGDLENELGTLRSRVDELEEYDGG